MSITHGNMKKQQSVASSFDGDSMPATALDDCQSRIQNGIINLFEVLRTLETRLDTVLTPSIYEAIGSEMEMKEVPLAPMVKTLSTIGDDIDAANHVVSRILYKLAL